MYKKVHFQGLCHCSMLRDVSNVTMSSNLNGKQGKNKFRIEKFCFRKCYLSVLAQEFYKKMQLNKSAVDIILNFGIPILFERTVILSI